MNNESEPQNSRMEKSLLIIHQGALGDFILTFPAIGRLQQYYRPIGVLCQNQLGQLAKSLGLAQDCFPSEAASFASLFSDRIDPIIKAFLRQYEHIILFTRSDDLAQSINRVSAKLSCRLAPKPAARRRIHVAEFVLDNIFNCGLLKKSDVRLDNIPYPVIAERPQHPDKILLHPGAGSTRKRWPVSNFIEVEARLKADGLKPEFVLGPAEAALAHELQHPQRPVHTLEDLLQLTALLRSAGGYIGNDSGASHLAAYLGLPATVIFGPADPKRWAPVGRAVSIVRPGLQCRPCFETEPDNCDEPRCLAGTSVHEVLEMFYSIYTKADKPEQLK
jgi:ADP-heptose:LPS heptosyltransferase